MDILPILNQVAGLVPYAKTLMSVLESLHVIKAQPGILDVIGELTPVAAGLFTAIDSVRSQTEATHPEVWASIRDDWKFTYDRWMALNPP